MSANLRGGIFFDSHCRLFATGYHCDKQFVIDTMKLVEPLIQRPWNQ